MFITLRLSTKSQVVNYVDGDERELSEIFMKLPSKRDLPDYYQLISQPIDLKKIKQGIVQHRYRYDMIVLVSECVAPPPPDPRGLQEPLGIQVGWNDDKEKIQKGKKFYKLFEYKNKLKLKNCEIQLI